MHRLLHIILAVVALTGVASQRPRILGGQKVELGEIPYQAALLYWGTNINFAGGVLLSNRWIVTTAHGLIGRPANSINIVLGVIRLDSEFISRQSDEYRVHPLYDYETLANDIATLRAAEVIVFSPTISPIELSSTFIQNEVIGIVSGWGATNSEPYKSNSSAVLKRAFVTVGPCENTEFITFSPLRQFCAGAPAGDNQPVVGICASDVGGPLIGHNKMLIGIPFYHDPRECGRYLDGYLRISYYRAWIIGNIE